MTRHKSAARLPTHKTCASYGGTTTTTVTDYVGGFVYSKINASTRSLAFISSPEGRVVKNTSGGYDYQYAIADHQGNTRVVFTSAAPQIETRTATFEGTDDVPYYKSYPTTTTNFGTVNDHTPSGTNAQLLYAGKVGISKSYHVYAGDKVQIDAWGMYRNLSGSGSDLTGFAATLLTAFQLPTPAVGETGTASSGLNAFGALEAGGWGDGSTDNTDVRAFVNIIMLDKNFKFIDAAYAQLTATTAGTYVLMSQNYTAKEEGYVYLYVSNENQKLVDVYFDDVTMTYTPTAVIQSNEYYPFGLQTANSWTRDNTTNNFLYDAGSELNSISGMYDLPYRNYDASLGRFFQVDPLSIYSHDLTPYHYANNNPINLNDPSGLMVPLSSNYMTQGQMMSLYRSDMGYMSYDSYKNWATDYSFAFGGADGMGGTWSKELRRRWVYNTDRASYLCGGNKGYFEEYYEDVFTPDPVKQDATAGSRVQNAIDLHNLARRKTQSNYIKTILEAGGRILDLSNEGYKMTTTNFQISNFEVAEKLKTAGKVGSLLGILYKIKEDDKAGVALELGKLGLDVLELGDGLILIEVGVDLLKLIGESGDGDYYQQLESQVNDLRRQAAGLKGHPDAQDKVIERLIPLEGELRKVKDRLMSR